MTAQDTKSTAPVSNHPAEVSDATTVGREIAAAMREAAGKDKAPVIMPGQWKRNPVPDKPAPGTAIMCDRFGYGKQVVELMHFTLGPNLECFPGTGLDIRGAQIPGQLWPAYESGEIMLLAFTPYPLRRSDGRYHFQHVVTKQPLQPAYPNSGPREGSFVEFDGTFYAARDVMAQEMMNRAKAAAKEAK